MAEEDVLGFEYAEIGTGLVVAKVEEVGVHHVLVAGSVVAVAIVVVPTRMLLKGDGPGDTGGGGRIVRSGSRPMQRTCQ